MRFLGFAFFAFSLGLTAHSQAQQTPPQTPPSVRPRQPHFPTPPQPLPNPQQPQFPLPLPPQTPLPNPEQDLTQKFLELGVPARGLRKIMEFRSQQMGNEFIQQVYECPNRPVGNTKPCSDRMKIPAVRSIKIVPHDYAVVIDYSRPSSEKRFFLLNFKEGSVESYLVAHGKKSGQGKYAYRFSNDKNSLETSLGLYVAGPIYQGGYGPTLRLFGLEKSNDQAYLRDIVMHGAPYADESFLQKLNHKTGKPYGRLGLSWGCPALSPKIAKRIVPLLQEGALIYHDHPELADEALKGPEVIGVDPESGS